MNRYAAQMRLDTPLGPLTLVATDAGLAGAWFDGQKHHPGDIDAPVNPEHPRLQQAAQALQAYWRGDTTRFDLPLDARGTTFQRAVWQALTEIDPGRTSTYGEIAARIGRPAAVRAVGAAVGRNPISVIVPCHRVIGHDGALTGYAGGLDRKRSLLALERAAGLMRGRDFADLLLLAALWGASFLFMKLGALQFGPAPLVFLRVAGAALMLLPLLAQRGELGALRVHWRALAVVGLANTALPFGLYMLAALVLSAGLMAIFNATAPLWGALIAWAWLGERPTAGARWAWRSALPACWRWAWTAPASSRATMA